MHTHSKCIFSNTLNFRPLLPILFHNSILYSESPTRTVLKNFTAPSYKTNDNILTIFSHRFLLAIGITIQPCLYRYSDMWAMKKYGYDPQSPLELRDYEQMWRWYKVRFSMGVWISVIFIWDEVQLIRSFHYNFFCSQTQKPKQDDHNPTLFYWSPKTIDLDPL